MYRRRGFAFTPAARVPKVAAKSLDAPDQSSAIASGTPK